MRTAPAPVSLASVCSQKCLFQSSRASWWGCKETSECPHRFCLGLAPGHLKAPSLLAAKARVAKEVQDGVRTELYVVCDELPEVAGHS